MKDEIKIQYKKFKERSLYNVTILYKEKEIYSLFSDFRTMELISSEISNVAKKVLIKVSKGIQKINDYVEKAIGSNIF